MLTKNLEAALLPSPGSYLRATRHPWACVFFVMPLLLGYEFGLVLMDAQNAHMLRNGADTWLRWLFSSLGIHGDIWVPGFVAAALIVWSAVRRKDRPHDYTTVAVGMIVESAFFALVLWSLSRLLLPILDTMMFELSSGPHALAELLNGVTCRAGSVTRNDPIIEQTIGYIGAGVYEETLFRLFLFSGLVWILTSADCPRSVAIVPAAFASAVAFAAAHHLGPHGESYEGFVFLFRTLAGLYFAFIYHFRGFAVAVGTHTLYDLFVGVLLRGV